MELRQLVRTEVMAADRRRGARAEFDGWVELTIGAERRLATSFDLSAKGLGLLLAPPHPTPGEPLESEFALPGFGVPLALLACVAWSDPASGRLGLRFDRLDLAVSELLQSAVAGRFRDG